MGMNNHAIALVISDIAGTLITSNHEVTEATRRAAYEPPGPETITFTVRAVDDASVQSDTEARFLAPTR